MSETAISGVVAEMLAYRAVAAQVFQLEATRSGFSPADSNA